MEDQFILLWTTFISYLKNNKVLIITNGFNRKGIVFLNKEGRLCICIPSTKEIRYLYMYEFNEYMRFIKKQ